MDKKQTLQEAYIKFELTQGRAPHSVFELIQDLELSESDFYGLFSSLQHLKSGILVQLLETTFGHLDADENYVEYSGKEKLLALYFTLFQQFLGKRSYLLFNYSDFKKAPDKSKDWMPFLKALTERTKLILDEAKAQQEIQDRPLIGDHYAKGFQLIFTYLFRVWINDESEDFATTDAAIEKSVQLSMELLDHSPLDALLDFGKFALKTKVF